MKLAVAISGMAPSFPDTVMEALVAQAVPAVRVSAAAIDTIKARCLLIAGPLQYKRVVGFSGHGSQD